MTVQTPEKDPQTVLTLSASREVPSGIIRSADHHLCESLAFPTDRRRNGDFWSKVYKTDCCWLWTRSRFQGTGYGAFWVEGKIKKAHRVAYELMYGSVPAGLDMLHDCDVRHCVRPGAGHARPGTHAENQQDMVRRGRAAPQDGERNGHAKFTWPEIHDIRARVARGTRRRILATEYGTSPHYVSSIVTQRVWPESKCPSHGVPVEAVA
jgi:HNH endonuclease